jgi:hypothetical protein
MNRSLHRAVIGGMSMLIFSMAANAALHARLGGAAAYDDVLDVTWLTDAGLSGSASWDAQLTWIDGLNAAHYLGFADWRLASMSVAAGRPTGTTTSVYDCSTIWAPLCQDNELGYMFYYNLGGALSSDLTGNRTVGEVTLSNIQNVYWSATEYAPGSAWILHFDSGFGVWSFKSGNRYGWAVRDGDVIGDEDGDGIGDEADNCVLVANGNQRDTDGDGFGNLCDPDLNNDLVVNAVDLALFKLVFFSADPDADFDGDGAVNAADLGVMRAYFFASPGPSGLTLLP